MHSDPAIRERCEKIAFGIVSGNERLSSCSCQIKQRWVQRKGLKIHLEPFWERQIDEGFSLTHCRVANIFPTGTEAQRVTLADRTWLDVRTARLNAFKVNQRRYFLSVSGAHGPACVFSPVALCSSWTAKNQETPVMTCPSLELNTQFTLFPIHHDERGNEENVGKRAQPGFDHGGRGTNQLQVPRPGDRGADTRNAMFAQQPVRVW